MMEEINFDFCNLHVFSFWEWSMAYSTSVDERTVNFTSDPIKASVCAHQYQKLRP